MKKRMGFVSNSSSSSFICDTKMSPEAAKEKLVMMLDFYNEFNDYDLVFESVFDEPFIATKEYAESSWAEYYKDIAKAEGKLIIEGASDNSIPYDLFDMIKSKFNATRCHLG